MKPSMVFGHRNVLAVVVPSARRVALARPSEPRARSSVGWLQLLSGRTALDTTAHAWLHTLKSASSAECPNFILVVQSMSESRRPCLASVSPTVCRLNASNRRQARPTACADHDVCVACAVLLGDPVQGECGPESSAPMAAEPAREWITSTRTIHRHAPMGDGTALAQAAPRHHGLLPCSLVAQEHNPHTGLLRPLAHVCSGLGCSSVADIPRRFSPRTGAAQNPR